MKSPLLLLSVAAALTGGCAIGPDYRSPAAAATPSHWSEALGGGEDATRAGLETWWKTFNDPELDSLIDRAVHSNLDLRMAQSRVREARAQYGIAASALAPSADASGSDARQEASHREPVLGSVPLPPTVSFDNQVYQAGVDASWEIDIFGGRRREVEAARAEVGASEFGERATMMVLLGDVARDYVDVRGYQRRLAIAADNIRAQRQGLAITRDRFAHGLATDLDVEESSAILAETQAEVPSLEAGLQASIHRLGVLLGREPGALLAELSARAPIPTSPEVVPVGLPSDLLLRRPDVRQAERQLAAATANIGVAEADLFPKFYLTGTAGYQSVSAGDWFSSGSSFWSIGPSVQWKIFDAGRVRANIRVQDARQEEALTAYERTVLTALGGRGRADLLRQGAGALPFPPGRRGGESRVPGPRGSPVRERIDRFSPGARGRAFALRRGGPAGREREVNLGQPGLPIRIPGRRLAARRSSGRPGQLAGNSGRAAVAQLAIDFRDVAADPGGGFAVDFENERYRCAGIQLGHPSVQLLYESAMLPAVFGIGGAADLEHVSLLPDKMLPGIRVEKGDDLVDLLASRPLRQGGIKLVETLNQALMVVINHRMPGGQVFVPFDHVAGIIGLRRGHFRATRGADARIGKLLALISSE
jgi:NodT family efflux transporter outer membrane factor (OMF) lipoprotein